MRASIEAAIFGVHSASCNFETARLDDLSKDLVTKMWQRNLLLGEGRVTEEKVEKIIHSGTSKWTSFHDACIDNYSEYMGIERTYTFIEERIKSELDGEYWK